MTKVLHTFEEYHFAFEFYHNTKLCITCYHHDKHIFTIYDNIIEIYNFSDTMRFFKLLQSFEHFSKATVFDYRDSIKYNFKTFNELTDYAVIDKLKKLLML